MDPSNSSKDWSKRVEEMKCQTAEALQHEVTSYSSDMRGHYEEVSGATELLRSLGMDRAASALCLAGMLITWQAMKIRDIAESN